MMEKGRNFILYFKGKGFIFLNIYDIKKKLLITSYSYRCSTAEVVEQVVIQKRSIK